MTPPPAGTFVLDRATQQRAQILAMLDAEIARLPKITRDRSDAWIRANLLPPAELRIGYPPPGSSTEPQPVLFEEDGRPIIEVPGDGSTAAPYNGPEGLNQLVRAHLRPDALIITYHGLMDRMSILHQPAGSNNVIVHHRFSADRLPDPLHFDLVYTPAP